MWRERYPKGSTQGKIVQDGPGVVLPHPIPLPRGEGKQVR